MSEEASDLPQPAPEPWGRRDADATVLPFPSSRPLVPTPDDIEPPRLRDVIGDVLRDERRRQERTLADVADEAAVSLPYLSEVERGRKEVSSDVLDAIGTALDLPLVEILERSAERLRTDGRTVGHRIEMSAVSAGVRGQRSICFRLAA